MAKYLCGRCMFSFKRTGEVETCPNCGSMSVRFENEDESPHAERQLYSMTYDGIFQNMRHGVLR